MLGEAGARRGTHPDRTITLVAAALVAVAGLPAVSAALASDADVDASCVRHELGVALVDGEPATRRLVGWLCAVAPYDGQTVIIASPTGLSDHSYWDWPVEKDAYSFARHATRAGYAVFNYDRIGTGESERPAAALVNLQTEAYVLHQLVTMLRAGDVGGVEFGKVVLIGNSISTLVSILEAELYRDVDGLVNTGIFVGPYPTGLAQMFTAFYPAQSDPKFADRDDVPPGYATTQPGARAMFFHLPTADPATLALDEELKDTATLGEAATFPLWVPFTRLVDVPILSVMGDHDILFCAPRCEPGGVEERKERLFWGPATCLEVEIVPESGHFLQLQRHSAAALHALADDWLERRVGLDAAHPPTAPCTP